MTVGLSDCRTVGILSENVGQTCRTVSDRGSGFHAVDPLEDLAVGPGARVSRATGMQGRDVWDALFNQSNLALSM